MRGIALVSRRSAVVLERGRTEIIASLLFTHLTDYLRAFVLLLRFRFVIVVCFVVGARCTLRGTQVYNAMPVLTF